MPEYFKPSVTADVLVLRPGLSGVEVLLIQRAKDPFAGFWALPGGFIEAGETLMASAQRELKEETGLNLEKLHFFGVYGDPGRDPRGRTITAAYSVWLDSAESDQVQGLDDADDARWFGLDALPELAFDHAQIIADGLRDFKARLNNTHPQFDPQFAQDSIKKAFGL